MHLSDIQERIGRGQYQVDTQAVADAIVRRLMQDSKHVPPEHKRAQGECS